MKIGIDARFYGPHGKGIGRYTQKLLASLEKFDHNNEYYVFLRQENFDLYKPQNPKFHKVLADYPWYSFKEQVVFPFKLYMYGLNLVHFFHFNVPFLYKKKFVVTIHDLIHHKASREASTLSFILFYGKRLLYFLVIRRAIKKSQKVITVSSHTKIEIIREYKVKPEKVIVTYEAA
ncbi:glycosyltransferase [Patescibacteria group bacterium AH-259-L05]|nr:glycosyltransferase [Patescibacteria group bacterium AH-259-L05]